MHCTTDTTDHLTIFSLRLRVIAESTGQPRAPPCERRKDREPVFCANSKPNRRIHTLIGSRSRRISQFQDPVRAKRYMEDGDRFFFPLIQEDVRLTSARDSRIFERWSIIHPIPSYIRLIPRFIRLFHSLRCLSLVSLSWEPISAHSIQDPRPRHLDYTAPSQRL